MPTSDVTPRGLAKASCLLEDGIILGGDILVIRCDKEKIMGSFLSSLIRFEETQILQLVTGSTVFHLYGSDMKNFSFLMPSLAEQTAIADILSDMDTEIDAMKAKLRKARQIKQGMMQELLTGKTRLV
jgi:type I restriction enzyme S subunit